MPYKGDKSAARPPEGCPAEAGGLFGPESALGFEHPSGTNARRPNICRHSCRMGVRNQEQTHPARMPDGPIFVAASHQTRLDTRSKARRPIKVGIKGRGRSGRSRDSNPACLCCSSAHLVQCEPDEASSFTNPNVGPGTYAS